MFETLLRIAIVVATAIATAAPALAGEAPWSLVRERDGITVHTRPVEGSGILEFKGEALVAAPAEAIRGLLRDAERFKDWFPNTSESKLLAREGDTSYQYSVLDTPWPVSDRDNVFKAVTRIEPSSGTIRIAISADPDRHPEQPDRVRVRRARGEWLLVPVSPEQTRVRFTMHLEPGGGVPQWMINAQVVETPFEALTNLRATLAGS